jgi:C4-dicarboxylate transporter, DctM subunit
VLGNIEVIYHITIVKPKLGPSGPRLPLRERIASLKSEWPVMLLFVFIIGGIYAGIFTPSEAAGMGVAGALILGLAARRLERKVVVEVLIESGRTTAMLFFVIIGTLILGNYLNLAGIPAGIEAAVRGARLSPVEVVWAMMLVCLVLGAIVESTSMILLTIPIFFPIIKSYGMDPVWFGIIMVVVTEISFIVPPLGLNLFVLKSTVPDLDTREIYRGIIPFIGADLVRLALLISVPAITLFLPQIMSK